MAHECHSNVFNMDPLDTCWSTEFDLNVSLSRIINVDSFESYADFSEKLSSLVPKDVENISFAKVLFYCYIVTGDERLLQKICVLGMSQEIMIILASEFLSAGCTLKMECFRNLLTLIDTFYSYVVQSNSLHALLRSLLQYVSGSSSSAVYTEIQFLSLKTLHRMVKNNPGDSVFISTLFYCVGRFMSETACESLEINSFFKDLISMVRRSNKSMGRDVLRVCLELCGRLEIASISDFQNHANTTSSHLSLVSRIPYNIWEYILFILDNVDREEMPNYVSLFNLQDFSEAMLVDIIRAIIVVYHPPNHVIASNKTQRWQLIISLLKTIKNPAGIASAKLAVYLDWFFPNSDYKHSVMLFEPGCLMLTKGSEVNSMIPVSLLEFLFLSCYNLIPKRNVFNQVLSAITVCVDLHVMSWKDIKIPSKCSSELRAFLQQLKFPNTKSAEESRSVNECVRKALNDSKILDNLLADLRAIKNSILHKSRTSNG